MRIIQGKMKTVLDNLVVRDFGENFIQTDSVLVENEHRGQFLQLTTAQAEPQIVCGNSSRGRFVLSIPIPEGVAVGDLFQIVTPDPDVEPVEFDIDTQCNCGALDIGFSIIQFRDGKQHSKSRCSESCACGEIKSLDGIFLNGHVHTVFECGENILGFKSVKLGADGKL